MLSPLAHRRLARAAAVACTALAALVPGVAVAATGARAHRPATFLTIAGPYGSTVSGTVSLSVHGAGSGVRRVVIAIDGHGVWTGSSAGAVSRVNTRTLRNGRHTLSVSVYYARRHTASARKTIVVRNPVAAAKIASHAPAPVAQPSRAPTTTSGTTTPVTSVPVSQPVTPPVTQPVTQPVTPPVTEPVSQGSGAANVGAFGPPTGGVSGASVAEFNRETYQYSTSWSTSNEADRYQFIVLAGNEYSLIPTLKAINPNLKFLLYQAIMFTNSNDYSWMPTVTGCTPYADDVANHPSWLLHDQNGNPVVAPNSTDYAMDVGNPGYQQACATNAANLAKQHGFDGVFFDVIEGNLGYTLRSGITVPEYPNNTAWQNAMTSALAYLGPAMHAQGLLAFGNVGTTSGIAQWEQWVGYLDGVEEESWTNANEGAAQQIPFFSTKLAELSWAMANGKYEIDHSFASDEAGNTYGLAAMLLSANGRASYATSNTNYTSNENWFPEYGTAQSLGAPAGLYQVLSNGVYERAFAHGIVLVNPTATATSAFSLDGGTYSGSGLTNVTSVSMGATSGLILLGG